MSIRRQAAFYGLLIAVVGVHLGALLIDRETWPYSQYAMFSDAATSRTADRLTFVGETIDGREIWLGGRALRPLSELQVSLSISRYMAQPARADLDRLVRDTFERYRLLRQRASDGGPPLRALRLYRFSWKLDPYLSEVHAPRKELIAAYPAEANRAL